MEGEREERRRSHHGETHEERKRRREEKRRRREERRERHRDKETEGDESPRSLKRPRRESDERIGSASASGDGAFVWKKKIEQQRRRGEEVGKDEEERRRKELAEELEAAKRRREERDEERAAWEEEQGRLAREKEQEENADWHRAEASFHGTQHFLRQAIRLRQGRPVGTDILAKNLRLDLLDVKPDENDPVAYVTEVAGRGMAELERLVEGIEVELDFIPDYPPKGDNEVFNQDLREEWWECVRVCALGLLDNERTKQSYGGARTVHGAVKEDLDAMLEGKSLVKLKEMEREISKRLSSGVQNHAGNEFAEVDFWTAALTRIHQRIAEHKLRNLAATVKGEKVKRVAAVPQPQERTRPDIADLGSGTAEELDLLHKERSRGLAADEEKFADEVEVPTKKRDTPAAGYAWNDKYRPRKPRYYNRVHTGYDWTKYNRTHYDHDNPPPKTVQGYRFNIFYPDLIDPSKTPRYTISRTDNPEVSIITFKAGPPYEDLAFKIVNRPWERSHRRGYRCSFDKGVLQLWFNFERYRYRR